MSSFDFFPTGQTRVGFLKTVGQVRRSRTPWRVSWGGRVSISQLPSSLEEIRSDYEPGVLMNFLCLFPHALGLRACRKFTGGGELRGTDGMWVTL